MSYINTHSLSFEEVERNSLTVVDLKTLQQVIANTFIKLFESFSQHTALFPPDPKKDEDEIMTMDEILKLLKVSKVTIHNWKKKGLIKSHKIGRKLFFKKKDVESALRQQKYSVNPR